LRASASCAVYSIARTFSSFGRQVTIIRNATTTNVASNAQNMLVSVRALARFARSCSR
jgi:hypothetical protein